LATGTGEISENTFGIAERFTTGTLASRKRCHTLLIENVHKSLTGGGCGNWSDSASTDRWCNAASHCTSNPCSGLILAAFGRLPSRFARNTRRNDVSQRSASQSGWTSDQSRRKFSDSFSILSGRRLWLIEGAGVAFDALLNVAGAVGWCAIFAWRDIDAELTADKPSRAINPARSKFREIAGQPSNTDTTLRNTDACGFCNVSRRY